MRNRLLTGLVVFSLSACNSGGDVTVVRVADEAAGQHCASGGVAIEAGIDANHDGTLGDDEVDGALTRYVCNGAAGADGANGQNGNDGSNGSNGTNGTSGSNGLNALTKVTAEPAGANCTFGGSRIDVGVDADSNGTLETGEVQTTTYVCNGDQQKVWYGDLLIRDTADVDALAGYDVLVGNLSIATITGGVVTFPDLKVVSGEISFDGSGGEGTVQVLNAVPVTSVSFPQLKTAGSFYGYYNYDLTSLSLPALTRVGSIDLYRFSQLASFSAPVLTRASTVRLSYCDYLSSVSMPQLASVGSLSLYGNALLTTLSFGALVDVSDSLDLSGNQTLSWCEALRIANQLTTLPSGLYLTGNDETATCATSDICHTVTVAPFTGTLYSCLPALEYAAAETTCEGFGTGAALTWFESAAELAAFQTAVSEGRVSAGWIGYSDATNEGTWVAAGGPGTFDPTTETTFWSPGEPNGDTVENFVEILGNGSANDTIDTSTLSFSCRVP